MLSISEIYGPVIQGEGPVIGQPTIFVRFGGCDYRCSWCDTLHAVLPEHKDEWRRLEAAEVVAQVVALAANQSFLITLSGGNPALFDCGELIRLLQAQGYRVAIETQGTKAPPWFSHLDVMVLSPKPPSSGMAFNETELAACVATAGPQTQTALKIVVGDEADYEFALKVRALHPQLPCYLQPLNPIPGNETLESALTALRWLMERVSADHRTDLFVLPQLHMLVYGQERGR